MATRNTVLLLRPYGSDSFDTDDGRACALVASLDVGHDIFTPEHTSTRLGYAAAATDLVHDDLGRVFYDGPDEQPVTDDGRGNPLRALNLRQVTKVLSRYARHSKGCEQAAAAHAYLAAVRDKGDDHLADAVVAIAYS